MLRRRFDSSVLDEPRSDVIYASPRVIDLGGLREKFSWNILDFEGLAVSR